MMGNKIVLFSVNKNRKGKYIGFAYFVIPDYFLEKMFVWFDEMEFKALWEEQTKKEKWRLKNRITQAH